MSRYAWNSPSKIERSDAYKVMVLHALRDSGMTRADLSRRMGVTEQRIGRLLKLGTGTFINQDTWTRICVACPWVAEVWVSAVLGRSLAAYVAPESAPDLYQAQARITREVGELSSAIISAQSDGHVDTADHAAIEREGQDVIREVLGAERIAAKSVGVMKAIAEKIAK